MVGELSPLAWKNSILAILDGRIRICGREKAETLAATLELDRDDLAHVIQDAEQPGLPDVNVSGTEAAHMLGLSISLMNGAAHLGLIRAKKTARKIEIPLSEVARFRDQYIVASEVKRVTGTGPQDFSASMRIRGFKPVGHMYNTYYWRRQDVRRLFPESI